MFVFLVEIKRLAEKEDWIVDSEGLTSLVSAILFVRTSVPVPGAQGL